MTKRDAQKSGHPIMRKAYDLSQDTAELRRDGKEAPNLILGNRADRRSPDEMMRQMGFDPTKHMNPLQFLIAVFNDDLDKVFENEARRYRMKSKGGIALSYRIEAAKTAAKFIHTELPKLTVTKEESVNFGASLSDAIEQGNERVRTRRVILEEIERTSPQIPLSQASYPPDFQGVADDDLARAEGDTDYDPDAE